MRKNIKLILTLSLSLTQACSAKGRRDRPNPQNEAGRAAEIVEKDFEEVDCPDRKAAAETG